MSALQRYVSGRQGTSALPWALVGLMVGALVAALIIPGAVGAQEQDVEVERGAMSLAVYPMQVDFDSDSEVLIYGAGFERGTEITLLITDRNGVISDISAATNEYPVVANDQGAFGVVWLLGNYTHEAVGDISMQTIWAVDGEFETLATVPIGFCPVAEEEEEVTEEEEAEEGEAEEEEEEEEEEVDELPVWCGIPAEE